MAPRIDMDTRKAQLAEAVWRVILDRGIAAVSVRTVADQAGLAVGSLRHVFPTRSELVQFSAELMVQRATDRVEAVPRKGNPVDFALDVSTQLLPLSADSRAEFEVNMALLAEAVAVPELVTIRDHAHQKLAGLCVQLVKLLTENSLPPEELSATSQRLHALIDGLSFHLMHQPPEADPTWALDILRRELRAITIG